MAIAVYDDANDQLRTFVHSTDSQSPLKLYEIKYSSVPSLVEIADTRVDRIIENLLLLPGPRSTHTRQLIECGFRSSLTHAIHTGEQLCGFLFFDSRESDYFTSSIVHDLSCIIQTASLLVVHHLLMVHMLRSAINMARELSRARDWETGNHLNRMARYSKLIAASLGPEYGFDDETVEYLFLFVPLHDLGKVGIHDHILLKKGALTPEEMTFMRSHVEKGAFVVDQLLADPQFGDLPHSMMLHNIVRHHHEALDGTGYPDQLNGSDLPKEARVVTVADVFDELTTKRPYKDPWSIDQAFEFLKDRAGILFDKDSVEALIKNRAQVEDAMNRFQDKHILPVSEE